MRVRRSWSAGIALWVVCCACTPVCGQDRPAVEGSWTGVMVYAPAEQEVEIAVELFQDARGVLAGLIDVPTKPVDHEPLADVHWDGTRVSWELRRDSGTFAFAGALSADRNEISGQFNDRGKTYPFTLKRRDPAVPAPLPVHPPLRALSPSGAELKETFNGDAGKVRLVLLLSPG